MSTYGDQLDRDSLKRLAAEYGAKITIRTGTSKIIDLLPDHIPMDAGTKENHDKSLPDPFDKFIGMHDKWTDPFDRIIHPHAKVLEPMDLQPQPPGVDMTDFSDQLDRDSLKKLVDQYGAKIKIRTGTGKIIDLLPGITPDVETIDDHSKVHTKNDNDPFDKVMHTHDKGPKPTHTILDGIQMKNGAFVGDLNDDQLLELQNVAADLLKGKGLITPKKPG